MDKKTRKIENGLLDAILTECSIQCQKCGKEKKEYNSSDFYFVEVLIRNGLTFKRGKVLCDSCS